MKKKVFQAITLAQLRQFIGNSRTVRRFADRHDLVYFGTVNAGDESRLVKGHTVSRTQQDEYYCVGTAYGHDMMFVQRTNTLHSSTEKHTERYVWNILVIDLRKHIVLPHTYVEGTGRYGRAFHESFSMIHRELSTIPSHLMSGYDPLFVDRFTCRTAVVHAADFPSTVSPLVAATLAHHFPMFDFEWHDDVLYVYFLSARPTLSQLEHMLKAGVWLAGELENNQQLTENR